MSQITHTFFDAKIARDAEHLIALDNLKRAQAVVAEFEPEDDPLQKCPGCNDCDCCGTEPTFSVQQYASRYNITMGTGATTQMNIAALKEAAREGTKVEMADGQYTFHLKTLEAVFAQLLKTFQHV
jgi:hypothetical protein